MRLTLRTLLAWLDGVLPEDEQQQLGAKVSSSVVATHLVERIRTAVGRTTIGAPRPDGRGLTEDPNSVAEYLDNTLSAEQLEAFERICIESELHLAEVAACHGLLAEVARDPAVEHRLQLEERQLIHQRLLGLLAGIHDRAATERVEAERRGDGHRESRETAQAIREAMASAASQPGPGAGAVTPSGEGVVTLEPERARVRPAERSSLAAWAAALVSLALLLALVAALVWSLSGPLAGRRPPEVARVEVQGGPQDPVVPPSKPVEGVPAVEDAAPIPAAAESALALVPETVPIPPATTAETGAESMSSELAADVSPEPEEPDPAASTALTVAVTEPLQVGDSASELPSIAEDDPVDSVGLVGGEGVLLRRTDAAEWTVFSAGSPLGQREEVLVPRGFQPELHVRGVTIRLLPETRAVLTVDPDGVSRIEVVFGRAVARANLANATLGISAGGLVGTVTAGLASPVAIEVELDRDPGTDPTSTPPRVRSRIYASRSLSWRQTAGGGLPAEASLEGIDAQKTLGEKMSFEWASMDPRRIEAVRNQELPSWVESGVRPDRLEKAAGEALASKVAATTPLTQALREMATDRRSENRTLAVSTLALLEEFDELVELLSAESARNRLESRQWSQLQAATVPLALARGGDVASRLFESFANRGPHGTADGLKAMALGFTDEGLAAGADRRLVEALEHPSLIVRRYAIESLIDITRPSAVDRGRYRPDGLPEMRREGVLWWRGQLEKGLVRRSPPAVAAAVSAAVEVNPKSETE